MKEAKIDQPRGLAGPKMTKTNTEIVREFIEAINRNQFDRIYEFCSRDCLFHLPPYVGLGVAIDHSSGQRVTVMTTAPGSPADGILHPEDELMQVSDGNQTWWSFEELKSRVWMQGVAGTPVLITVRRNGERLELKLLRGPVHSFDQMPSDYLETWRKDQLKHWPDLKIEIQFIFESDDLVAYYAVDRGTSQESDRSAIWGESGVCRIQEGKIIEAWNMEDRYAQIKQLGYDVIAPRGEPA